MYPGHWAKVSPEKPALINAATGDVVTFRELNDRSNRLAQLLWERGLRRGDHIAILMENHARYFDVIWAALRSGLVSDDDQSLSDDRRSGVHPRQLRSEGADRIALSRRHRRRFAGGVDALQDAG